MFWQTILKYPRDRAVWVDHDDGWLVSTDEILAALLPRAGLDEELTQLPMITPAFVSERLKKWAAENDVGLLCCTPALNARHTVWPAHGRPTPSPDSYLW